MCQKATTIKTILAIVAATSCLVGCDTTSPRPATAQDKPKTITQKVVEIPKQFLGNVFLPGGETAAEEIASSARASKDQIEKIDVDRFNAVVAELHETAKALKGKIESVDTGFVGRAGASLEETISKLSTGLETFTQKLSQIDIRRINETTSSTSEAVRKVGEAAGELSELIRKLRDVVAAIKPEDVSGAIERLHQSAAHFETAAARLPSTTTTLSTTIWLANALLAIGVTLGIIHIIRLRKPQR